MITYSTTSLILSSLLGFLIYLTFDWQEWQKLTQSKMSLVKYIKDDQSGVISAVLLSIASFIALPELAKIAWLHEHLGFTANKTPLSAMGASFLFAVAGRQLRAIVPDLLATWLRKAKGGA